MRALLFALPSALVILACGPAQAAPVVLHGPENDAVSAATIAKELLGSGDFQVAGALTAAIGDDPTSLVVVGGTLSECEASEPADLSAVVAAAAIWVDQMEYSSAMRTIDDVVNSLPCSGGTASRVQLFDVWFLRGIAAFNDGDEATARSSFVRATAIDPSRKWDEAFPPTPKPLYLEALQETLASAPSPLTMVATGVAVDGTLMPAGERATVRSGEHVLSRGEATWGLTITAGGGSVLISTADELAAGVLGGSEDGAAWLREQAAAQGWDDVLIVDGDEALRFRDGAFVRDAPPVAAGPPPLLVAGIGTAGAGLGIALAGVGANAAAWRRAALSDDGKSTPLSRAEYEAARTQTQASTGVIVAGAVTLAAGAGMTLVSLLTGGPPAVAVMPSVGVSPDGFALGFSGRF